MPIVLLFDIDGTLLWTGGAGRIAFNKTFEDLFGIRHAWGDLCPDGKTDPGIIRELGHRHLHRNLSEKEFYSVENRYRHYFTAEIDHSDGFCVLPGILVLLDLLARHPAIHLGLATGNFQDTALLKLRRGGLDHFFRFGGYGSDHAERPLLTRKAYERACLYLKTEIPPQDCFVIGDTPHDVLAGKSAGMKTLGVLTGKSSRREMEAAGADHIFYDLTDSRRFLEIVTASDGGDIKAPRSGAILFDDGDGCQSRPGSPAATCQAPGRRPPPAP